MNTASRSRAMSTPPRAAVLTAPTRGAIGVIAVWGEEASGAVGQVFRSVSGTAIADSPVGRPRLGRVGAGLGDEVVAIQFEAPPRIELHCHGGPAAIRLVLEALGSVGVEIKRPLEWLRYKHAGRIEQQASWLLAHAPTARTALMLHAQAQGALRAALEEIARHAESAPETALMKLRELKARSAIGTRLVTGWRVALCGRPNVGKSTLLNALIGYQRAIVDQAPGTTRDVLATTTALDGWPVTIIDTAGIRATEDPVEVEGVRRAGVAHREADAVLHVLDLSRELDRDDEALLSRYPEAIRIANKTDLPSLWRVSDIGALAISAHLLQGIDELIGVVVRKLVSRAPDARTAMPIRLAQARQLEHAESLIARGEVAAARACILRLLR